MSRVPADQTAFGRRDMPYLLELDSTWTAPEDDERNITWTRKVSTEMEKYSNGGYYLNFPGSAKVAKKFVRSAVDRKTTSVWSK